MCVYLCVYVCVCVFMCVYVHACVCVCVGVCGGMCVGEEMRTLGIEGGIHNSYSLVLLKGICLALQQWLSS